MALESLLSWYTSYPTGTSIKHSLHTLNAPKEAPLLVIIWTHLEWRIYFFSNVNNIANTQFIWHSIAVSPAFGSSVLVWPAKDSNLVFSPPVTLWNCDCQRNHNPLHVKPDYLYYYYISWSLLCLLYLQVSMNISHHSTCYLSLSIALLRLLPLMGQGMLTK